MSDSDSVPVTPDYVVNIKWALEGLVMPTVGVIGIIGNLATLAVLFNIDLGFKSSFTRLISNLCIFDSFCILFNLTIFTFPLLSESYRHQVLPHILPLVLPLAQIALTGSVYTVVAVALERFTSVKRPHIHLSSCTMFAISITILVLSFLANLNRFFEYETQPIVASYPSYLDVQGAVVLEENLEAGEIIWKWNLVKPTKLRLDKDYAQISTIVSVLLSLVPFTFLIILNILIFRTIKQKTPALSRSSRRQRRDIFVASILILIIMVYAACHSIKVFINILELFCVLTGRDFRSPWSPNMNILVSLSHILITVNCSSNFAIYCSKDVKFRQAFFRIISCGIFKPSLGFHLVSSSVSRESSSRRSFNFVRGSICSMNQNIEDIIKTRERRMKIQRTYTAARTNIFGNNRSLVIDEPVEMTSV